MPFFARIAFVLFTLTSFSLPLLSYQDRGKSNFGLCSSCHGPEGQGNVTLKAPAIAGLPDWYIVAQLEKFSTGVRGKHPDYAPGIRMYSMARNFKDNKEDIAAIAAYVSSLPKANHPTTLKGDVAKGKELYAVCTACHGIKAEGNKALNAPPLAHLDDWYQMEQLHNFRNGIRAGNPSEDPTGATMVPMAKQLADEKAIVDVSTYIQSLKQ
jgi:cytochrome c553